VATTNGDRAGRPGRQPQAQEGGHPNDVESSAGTGQHDAGGTVTGPDVRTSLGQETEIRLRLQDRRRRSQNRHSRPDSSETERLYTADWKAFEVWCTRWTDVDHCLIAFSDGMFDVIEAEVDPVLPDCNLPSVAIFL
jgi:hypothetical protein